MPFGKLEILCPELRTHISSNICALKRKSLEAIFTLQGLDEEEALPYKAA